MFKFLKSASFAAFMLFSVISYAQMPTPGGTEPTKVSDTELEEFVTVFQELQTINQGAQDKMIEAVEGEDMTVERFTEIQESEQNPASQVEVSDEEMKQYQAGVDKVMKIQTDIQEVMMAKIEDSKLSIERYQQIAGLLQNDPELQQRVQAMMQG